MDVIELTATCYAVDRLASPSLHDYPTGLVLRNATAEELLESEYAGESGAFRAVIRAEWLDEGARWRLRVIDGDDYGAALAIMVDGDRRITEAGAAVFGLQPSRLTWPAHRHALDLKALRAEAAAGDIAQVALCDLALDGDRAAYAECCRVVDDAAAMADDD